MDLFSLQNVLSHDYISFIAGYSLLSIGAAILSFSRLRKEAPLILWFSLFLILCGFYEWSGIVHLEICPGKCQYLLWLAFGVLIEGLRRNPRGKGVSAKLFYPLAAAFTGLIVWIYGTQAASIFIGVFFAIPAVLWTTYRIISYIIKTQTVSAIPLLLPALAALLLYTAAKVFMESPLLSAAAATLMLSFGWFYLKLFIQKPRSRFMIYFPVAAYIVGILVGGLVLGKINNSIERAGKNEFMRLCTSIAAAVNADRLRALTGTSADLGTETLLILEKQGRNVFKANPGLLRVFLAAPRDNEIRILVSGNVEPETGSRRETWANPPQEFFYVLKTGNTALSAPYLLDGIDRLACFAPIKSSANEDIAAVLVMEADYKQWQAIMLGHKLPGLTVVALVMFIMFIFFAFYEYTEHADRIIFERESWLNTTLRSISDGVIATDGQGRITFVNHAAEELLGIKESQARGLLPAKVLGTACELPQDIASGQIGSKQCVKLKTDGAQERVAEISITPLRHEAGEKIGSVIVLRDITSHILAEETLRRERDFSDTIIDTMPHIFFIMSDRGRFVRWNGEMLKRTGLSHQAMTNAGTMDFVAEEDRVKVVNYMRNNFTRPGEMEIRINTIDGLRTFQSSTVPIAVGGQNFMIVFSWDVTETRRFTERMRMAAEEWEASFNSIPDIMFVTDTRYRIIRANTAFMEHAGTGDVIGKTCQDVIGQKSTNWLRFAIETVDFTKMAGAFEIFDPETQTSLLVISSHLKDDVAQVKGMVFVIRNISDIKKAAVEMQSIAEMKSRFLSVASHELRTPLSAIKDSITLVAEDLKTADPQQRELIEIAKRNIDRLARLINNLLDFQRLEAGKLSFHPAKNNLEQVVNEVCALFHKTAQEKGIAFTAVHCADMPPLEFDRDKIIQVLSNLVGNAVKFTEKGGVAIETRRRENSAEIRVSDTGPGIKPEDLARLFQPFEQVGENTGRMSFGSGLGLVIARQLIELHGGSIRAESVPGKGTTFSFDLPFTKQA